MLRSKLQSERKSSFCKRQGWNSKGRKKPPKKSYLSLSGVASKRLLKLKSSPIWRHKKCLRSPHRMKDLRRRGSTSFSKRPKRLNEGCSSWRLKRREKPKRNAWKNCKRKSTVIKCVSRWRRMKRVASGRLSKLAFKRNKTWESWAQKGNTIWCWARNEWIRDVLKSWILWSGLWEQMNTKSSKFCRRLKKTTKGANGYSNRRQSF